MENLEIIKMFHLALMYVDTLPEEDVDTVFEALHSNRSELATAAAQVLVELKKPAILRAIKEFDSFPKSNQKTVIMFLSLSSFVESFAFLLNTLESSTDSNIHHLITTCISKTHYQIQPLILARLNTENPVHLGRYKILIKAVGLTKFETLLAMLPSLPHERLFREVFGDAKIDRIKY